MKLLCVWLLALSVTLAESREIKFVNKCGYNIWINPKTNFGQGADLADGIQKLQHQGRFTYKIPNSIWGGRFWPKTGCDANGQNCKSGQSVDPCLPTGCDPPAETKVEFYFPAVGDRNNIWYDVSLVDGYSLPAKIEPSVQEGTCVTTNCNIKLDDCPTNENSVGDLRVRKNGRTVQCLAPCKKWNYPSPFGLGKNEQHQPGLYLCCPTPPVSPESCRAGPVVQTKYVELVHRECPTAYAYAYDDEAGLHNCPNSVDFTVTFCP